MILLSEMDFGLYSLYSSLFIFVMDIILYPSELLTTRIQADCHSSSGTSTTLRLAYNIVKKDGVGGLFKGFTASSIGSFPGQYLYYLSYEQSCDVLQKSSLVKNSNVGRFLSYSLSGAIAELVSSVAYLPCDIVTQRLQMHGSASFYYTRYQQSNAISAIRQIIKQEGPAGFFRGFASYNITYAPSSMIWWLGYELSKTIIPNLKLSSDWYFHFKLIICGCIAGTLTSFITNPLEVAKTRLQLLEVSSQSDFSLLRKGFFHILSQIYKNEGMSGLFKGVKLRLVFRVPGSALTIFGYEYIKALSLQN